MKNIDQLTESYNYDLPDSFIASRPAEKRDESKLLVYNAKTGEVTHSKFKNLGTFLVRGQTLAMNQSKVFPCRLFGQKPTGGRVELFLLSLIPENGLYSCLIRTNGKKKSGDILDFDKFKATIKERKDDGEFLVEFNIAHGELLNILEEKAQIPIPPYIRDGVADEKDTVDYQTVYAKNSGSVAAPTAGLHFTPALLQELKEKGIDQAFVTLHVGVGTFKTVNTNNILDHQMHSEYYQVDSENLDRLNTGDKIIAVGTTSLRVLESIYADGKFKTNPNDLESTNIFLYPGKEVKSIAGLITNFHLPKSTLLMLVSAIIGREKTLELYEIAKENHYRFFSYGDAMLILR